MADQPREVTCPFCSGSVLVKTAGRAFASITGWIQRNFNIQIPTTVVTYLKENLPVGKSSVYSGKCPACGGKGKMVDPSDDNALYQQIATNAQAKSNEIAQLESALSPGCGNRYTILQGCDVLEVGLGFNDIQSYRVDKDASIRNWGITSQVSQVGGIQIPKGAPANHVQGLNVTAAPGNTGMYTIKCSNKFSVLAGALGVDITTGGPLSINAGITQIIAPEITLGCKSGRLLLEGDTVNINGRSIEVSPTDGHFFVKGTMSNTGNLLVGGHAHAESISFVNASCTGRNETSKISSPGDLVTGPAFWGPVNSSLITAKDLVGFVTQNTTHPVFASQITSLAFVDGMSDKMTNMLYSSLPQELQPSGYSIDGVVYLYPHTHALPDMKHVHETRIPNIDCSADDSKAVRGKVGNIESSAPHHVTTVTALDVVQSLFSGIGSTISATMASIKNNLYETFIG